MIRGMYTGASGMAAQMHRMDTIANNLANVDVTGYKRDTAISKAFPELLLRRMNDNGVYKFPFGSAEYPPVVGMIGTGVEMNEAYTVFSQGAFKETNNVFDIALEGEGFFAIQTPDGERYTRNGTFLINDEGVLVTKEGHPVLGEQGIIRIKKHNFIVDKQGRVFQNKTFTDDPERLVSMEENEWENTELLDKLKIMNFERVRYLKKQGSSMWASNRESGEAFLQETGGTTKVYQGFLEGSNVNSVTEMVRMIEVNRAYEANQKLIQSEDYLSGKLINDAAKF
ncbi:MAG: flagellar basal-body rod protein FlgF [Spirochaetales bacterium]|nr:flagellar basal-body rod protein FlgF [Spirochaetales bacterium]